ncbi:hypothetical protein G6F23_015223 [Rhizopus arrhizus]|nr:hypothetical protein G6F23_015223 [Rhizopus arrhizus]KAG0739078.1 hypothetical protein G6F24_017443 [Rhizopus arrhizus]
MAALSGDRSGKPGFYPAPTGRVVSVVVRQPPDHMQMVWQQHGGKDREGRCVLLGAYACLQKVGVERQVLVQARVGGDGEKVGGARDVQPPV